MNPALVTTIGFPRIYHSLLSLSSSQGKKDCQNHANNKIATLASRKLRVLIKRERRTDIFINMIFFLFADSKF